MSDFFKSKLRPVGRERPYTMYNYHPTCECCGEAKRYYITKTPGGRWGIGSSDRPFKYVDSLKAAKKWMDADMANGGPMRRLRLRVKRWGYD